MREGLGLGAKLNRHHRDPLLPVHADSQRFIEADMAEILRLADHRLLFQDLPADVALRQLGLDAEITDVHRHNVMEEMRT